MGGPDVSLLTNGVTSTYYTVEISPMSLSVTNQFMRGGDRVASGPPLQLRYDVRQTVHTGCMCCGNANFRACLSVYNFFDRDAVALGPLFGPPNSLPKSSSRGVPTYL